MAKLETKGDGPRSNEKRGGYPSAPKPTKIPPLPKKMPTTPKKKS